MVVRIEWMVGNSVFGSRPGNKHFFHRGQWVARRHPKKTPGCARQAGVW
jgi:hypothetical protein